MSLLPLAAESELTQPILNRLSHFCTWSHPNENIMYPARALALILIPPFFQLVSSQDYDVADISCSFGQATKLGSGGGGNGDAVDVDPEGLTALLRDGRMTQTSPQLVSCLKRSLF